MNPFWRRIKSWRIGDYFRQFSVVTAGIVVTFVGSDLISNYSTDKEIRSTMNLIVKELESNRAELNTFIEKHENDRLIASYLVDSKFDVSNIAVDTLQKYFSFMSQLSSFRYSTDALDVLKGSSLMQKIDDKDILLSLIKTYQDFQNIQQAVVEYYDLKKSVIVPLALSSDDTSNGDIYSSYALPLSVVEMRNFCVITIGFFDDGYLRGKIADIDKFTSKLRGVIGK